MDRLKEKVGASRDPGQRWNIMLEYMQWEILTRLGEVGANKHLAFLGGTALRMLFGMHRYSQDLDFALAPDSDLEPIPNLGVPLTQQEQHEQRLPYDHEAAMRAIVESLNMAGWRAQLGGVNVGKAVYSAWISFPGLPGDLGISPDRNQALKVKIEIDSRPPYGARRQTSLLERDGKSVSVLHNDLPTLMAGKINAILTRNYTKARDIYDLYWYLNQPQTILPNLVFLNNALAQVEREGVKVWTGPVVTRDNWRSILAERIRVLDWDSILANLEKFVEAPENLHEMSRQNMLQLLRASSEIG